MESTKEARTERRGVFGHLDCQSLPLIGPFERLGHRLVVILDEGEHLGL